jgi:folate-binding protein YgfZ
MIELSLHGFHQDLGATFGEVNGMEAADHYSDPVAEHAALRDNAGVLDLSFRGRLCLTGADRVRLLNGQVTNDVKMLSVGTGCYAAVVTAKGKMESDANIYCLPGELLLDFEPGLTAKLSQRFEKYIIADDVQVVDVAPLYGLLSVQGPQSATVVQALGFNRALPLRLMEFSTAKDDRFSEIYCVNHSRTRALGFDLFVPAAALAEVAGKLVEEAAGIGGRACGWRALEMARIEAGIPRYGVDMDDTNLAPEAGIERQAISYTKGCYIGQEVIARLRTYGQVAKALRGLRLEKDLKALPVRGDRLWQGDQEIGYVTSSTYSPTLKSNIALGYVRRECNEVGSRLTLRTAAGDSGAEIVPLPFID